MKYRLYIFAVVTLMLCLWQAPAAAQAQPLDRLRDIIDSVARGVNIVGQKAEDLLGPAFGPPPPEESAHAETRLVEERYPVTGSPVITIDNKFGAIRVKAWNERVVQLEATITVGADQQALARRIAQTIDVTVSHSEEQMEIRTLLPDTRNDSGVGSIAVDYTITAPADSTLITQNYFGDTFVEDFRGPVSVAAQYGLVSLDRLEGPARVQAWGPFPLRATDLSGGGFLELNDSRAELRGLSGEWTVSSRRGNVDVFEPGVDLGLDISSESAPVRLVMPPDQALDVSATVVFGELQSAVPLNRTQWGNRTVAWQNEPDASVRIVLDVVFADAAIEYPADQAAAPQALPAGAQPFSEVVEESIKPAPDATLVVDALVGDVLIEGTTEGVLRVEATKIVWAPSAREAPPALKALAVQVQEDSGRVDVRSLARERLQDLGSSAWRVDLRIQAPQHLPVRVYGQRGRTRITGMLNGAEVVQTAGSVHVENTAGALNLTNQEGDVEVAACSGPVEVSNRYGVAEVRDIAGPVSVRSAQGRTIIEAPQNDVFVRHVGGDVRILALDQLTGAFDVLVENGDISMIVDKEADATLEVVAAGGIVQSAIPLTGTLTRELRQFSARLGDGTNEVRLETRNGDIVLD